VVANVVIRIALLIALLSASTPMQVEVRQQSGDFRLQHEQEDRTSPGNTMEILPAAYIGCWRGVVGAPDASQNLNGCLNGPFIPELYTLCYRKTSTGTFDLTFSGVQIDTAVPEEYQISGTSGKVEVLSSDRINRVTLRSFIHFEQLQTASLAPSDSKWSMDEQTDLICEIKAEHMEVKATFTQTSDGTECFKGTWHTLFNRFAD
jgi:hypothetical protein